MKPQPISADPIPAAGRLRQLLNEIFSTHHRTIGFGYLLLSLIAGMIGTLLSLFMRLHLAWPSWQLPLHGPILPEEYLALVTMHGTLMLFFVLTVAPQSGFSNLILPAQLGARHMAFPRLNATSMWLTAAALFTLLAAFFVPGGAPIGGWTAYPPLSATPLAGPGQGAGMDLWLASIAIFAIATTLSSINTLTTIVKLRCEGLTWERLPLTVWGWFTSSLLSILAFSVLLAAILLLFCDRHLHSGFFLPAQDLVSGVLLQHRGDGTPLLWLHLFWFFGHPEVYIAILPGMGLTSMVIANFSHRRVFAYRLMIATTLLIGFLGILVWGHHMFVAGLNPFAGTAFSISTMAIAIPASAKVLSWLATTWGSRPRLTTPMLFALGFVSPLHHRRPLRPDPRPAHPRRVPPQHLLRRRPLPPHHGHGRHLRPLLRHLLLGPTALPPRPLRTPRQAPLLGHDPRRLLHLSPHALHRPRRRAPPLRPAHRPSQSQHHLPAIHAPPAAPHHLLRHLPACSRRFLSSSTSA